MPRREQRERIVLPVLVHGSNARGEPLSETGCVTDASQNGARVEGVQCLTHINEIITLEHEGQQIKFRVAWIGETGTRMAGCAGLQSLEPLKKLFHIELAPPGPDSFDPTLPHGASTGTTGVIDRRVVERRQQEERRRWPRYKCTGTVEVRLEGAAGGVWAKVSDICLGGCYAELMSPFAVDTRVELTFTVLEQQVRTKGLVRSHHPGFGMGIAFADMAADQMASLQHIIARLSGAATGAPAPKPVPAPAPTPIPAATRAGQTGPSLVLDAVVKWFAQHETLSRADFLKLIQQKKEETAAPTRRSA